MHKCGKGGSCRNMYGGYTCFCHSGYRILTKGFDTECVGKSILTSLRLQALYSSDNLDKDECNVYGKPCQHLCTNTEGTYECSCPTGYELQRNGKCRDIDECGSTADCGPGLTCHNTQGSYKCVNLSCPAGYKDIPMRTADR